AFGAAEWSVAGVGIDILPSAVIGCPEDVSVLVETQCPHLVHYPADAGVVLDDRIGVLAFRRRFMHELGSRQIRLVHLHEIDAHEEWLAGFRCSVEIIDRRFLNVIIEERDPDYPLSGVFTYWPLILNSSWGLSPALPDSAPLVTWL